MASTQEPLSPDAFSATLSKVYECAVDPALWPDALREIARFAGASAAAIDIREPESGACLLKAASIVDGGARPAFPVIEPASFSGVSAFSVDAPSFIDAEDVSTADEGNHDECLSCSWPGLSDVNDIVLACVVDDETAWGILAVGFGRRKTPEPAPAGLDLILPHVRRAYALSARLDQKRARASRAETALDLLGTSVLMVNDHLRVVHLNRSARALLAAQNPLATQDGFLQAHDPSIDTELRNAALLASARQAQRRPSTIAAKNQAGEPVVFHVEPLPENRDTSHQGSKASIALFVTKETRPSDHVVKIVSRTYGLTPSEETVFGHIADGKTQSEIASLLGVASSTVKSHLLRVFHKTGTKRQVDIVRLARRLTLP